MERPPAHMLQKSLKCALGVSEAAALEACEEAVRDSGYLVATRLEHCLVLLPLPTASWARCLAPRAGEAPCKDRGSGRGVTVEFVPNGAADGRLLVSVTTAKLQKGRAFLGEFRSRLKVAAQRAKLAGHGASQEGFGFDSAAYYHASRLLCGPDTQPGRILAEFLERFKGTESEEQALPECRQLLETLLRSLKESWEDWKPVAGTAIPTLPGDDALRACAERCLFARLGPGLWQRCRARLAGEDAGFRLAAGKAEGLSDEELLNELGVPAGIHGLETAPQGRSVHRRAAVALARLRGEDWPGAPREALRALALAQLEMRMGACEASKGSVELDGGEEAARLFAFVLLRAGVSAPFACRGLLSESLGEEEHASGGDTAALSLLEAAARHASLWGGPDGI